MKKNLFCKKLEKPEKSEKLFLENKGPFSFSLSNRFTLTFYGQLKKVEVHHGFSQETYRRAYNNKTGASNKIVAEISHKGKQ